MSTTAPVSPLETGAGMSPRRIQRRRTKGWRMPEGAVYVDRPTKWGNPWRRDPVWARVIVWEREDGTQDDYAVGPYREELESAIADPWGTPHALPFRIMADDLHELRGKDLVCWCKPGEPCHADVLLELANA